MLNDMIKDLRSLEETDLRTLNAAVIDQIKLLRNRKNDDNRHVFKAGDRVKFDGRRGGMIGTVKRIKRKKAIIDTGELRCWDVPLGMLRRVV